MKSSQSWSHIKWDRICQISNTLTDGLETGQYFQFCQDINFEKKPSCCPLKSRDQETHLMASSHLRSDTHLWHIRLCTMERQASAEVGALLLMSWPRSSLPHGSDPGLGSDKAEITSLDGGLTSSAPVCRCQLSEMEKFY